MITASAITALHGLGYRGPGFGWWFLLFPLFWIALVVVLIAFFGHRWRRARMHDGDHGRTNPSRQAEATLAERFAKGDIDDVEYGRRLEVLRAHAQVPPGR